MRTGRLELAIFATALVALVATATGGPGWDAASAHAVLAAHLERTASAPLYGVLAAGAAQLPAGEIGFRLALLSALIGAATLAGVVAAARAMLSKQRSTTAGSAGARSAAWGGAEGVAGAIAAVLLVLAPPFREATVAASPSLLAAAGAVWALAGVLGNRLPVALLGCTAVLGSAPWLGAAITIAVFARLARTGARRDHLSLGAGAIGLVLVTLWLGALGSLPELDPSLTAMVAATGRGSAAILVGAGLLGAAFGAATGLAPARIVSAAIALAIAHAIVVDPAPAPVLALLAVGVAVVPSAIARVAGTERRALVSALAGLPLLGAAFATGAQLRIDDPGDAPARLATDVIGELPSGPGVIVATSGTAHVAIAYAQGVAGARPDLALVPPLAPIVADAVIADALRAEQLAISDVPAVGRLDPARALPRGRGFELRLDVIEPIEVPPPPATYASATGEREAVALALARARYEATHGRLDAAARAAGLTSRFGAAELAMLATTAPSRARPALFGLLPRLAEPASTRWRLELFGDDLAWVAGIDQPLVEQPPARKLHGLWREVLAGRLPADDPAIAALGPEAVAATRELVAAVRPAP